MNNLPRLEPTPPAREALRTVVALANKEYRRFTEASLLVRSPGSYLIAYTAFGASPRDDSDAIIMGIESHNGGISWEEPFLITSKEGGVNIMAPSLLKLSDGRVAMVYLAKQSMQHAQIVWMESSDDGKSWSAPRIIYDQQRYTICLNNVLIELTGGRLLFPVFERLPGQAEWSDDECLRAFCLYSDDGGASWQRSQGWIECPGHGAMEPVAFERAPGRLRLYLRTDQGTQWEAESEDNGTTWSKAVPGRFESPESPCMVYRMPGRDEVIFVHNSKWQPELPAGGPRIPLTLAISRDRGETWHDDYLCLEREQNATYSYPSITCDGQYLLLTYYHTIFRVSLCDRPDLMVSLCFQRIPLETLEIPLS